MRMNTVRNTTRGSVIVECALLIPLILMIAMCGAEFTRCLRAVKIAQALSEEAANLAYRECSSLRTLQVTRCLEDAQQQVSAFALTIDNVGLRDANSSYVWIKVFVNNPGNCALHRGIQACRRHSVGELPRARPNLKHATRAMRNPAGSGCASQSCDLSERGRRRCRLRSLLRNRADRQALRLLAGNRHHHKRPGVLQRHNRYLARLPWRFERAATRSIFRSHDCRLRGVAGRRRLGVRPGEYILPAPPHSEGRRCHRRGRLGVPRGHGARRERRRRQRQGPGDRA